VDAANGDYRLAARSPAIDSGRGFGASSTDLFGQLRRDDAGVPNKGNGFPGYVDIGALERQGDTAAPNLAVTNVSRPLPNIVQTGELVLIEYQVSNVGKRELAAGNWQDRIFLSSDPFVGNDILLATVDITGPLGAGGSYTKSLSLTVPEATGPQFLIVTTGQGVLDKEASSADNFLVASDVLAINVPLLATGDSINGTTSSRSWQYYRLHPEAGQTLRVSVSADSESTQVFVRRGLPPTHQQFEARSPLTGNASSTVRLLEPEADTYFIGVFGQGSFQLSVSAPELAIDEVAPSTFGNMSPVTLRVSGDGFQRDAAVQIVAESGQTITGETRWQDSATLLATFDFPRVAAASGIWNVQVVNSDTEVITSADTVKIEERVVTGFEAEIDLPGGSRPGRPVSIRVEYENTGLVDIPSPVLQIDGGEPGWSWMLPGANEWLDGAEIRFLAVSSDGDPTVLRPGQSETIFVRARTPFRPGDLHVNLFSIGGPTGEGTSGPIDWNRLEAKVLPPGAFPETWDAAFSQLKTSIGPTWTDYAIALGNEFKRWQNAGGGLIDAERLLRHEVDKALNHPIGIMSGRVADAFGNPLIGVEVSSRNLESGSEALAVTNDQGLFVLYGLAPGAIEVTVAGQLITSNAPDSFPQSDHLIDIQLEVVKAGHVQGRLVDAVDNSWLADAQVVVRNVGGDFVVVGSTDINGQFDFGELPSDTYSIDVEHDNYLKPTVENIDVLQGVTLEIDLSLNPGATIYGRLTSVIADTPIDGQQVTAVSQVTGDTTATVTQEDGTFFLSTLPAGTYDIVTNPDGYLEPVQVEVTVATNSETRNVSLVVDPGANISGTIVESDGQQPIADAEIEYIDADDELRRAFSDANGFFEFTALKPGNSSLVVRHQRFISSSPQAVTIVGREEQTVVFELEVGASVHGTVLDSMNMPLGGVNVVATSVENEIVRAATTSATGTYLIEGLSSGEYSLTVRKSGYATQMLDGLALIQPDEATDIDFLLPEMTSLSGTVIDHLGDPVAGASIFAHSEYGIESVVQSDDQGEWQFNDAGNAIYYVRVDVPGRGSFLGLANLRTGAPITNLAVVLGDVGQLAGTVTTADLTPLADATVQVIDDQGRVLQATTSGVDGSYELNDVMTGDFQLEVFHPDHSFDRQTVTILSGSSSVVDFSPISHSISGSVRDADTNAAIADAILLLLPVDSYAAVHAVATTTSDANGEFTWPQVPAGEYVVHAFDPQGRTTVESLIVDGDASPVDLTLSPGFYLEGPVRLADSEHVLAGAAVRISLAGQVPFTVSTFTGTTGDLQFGPIPAGDYTIHILSAESTIVRFDQQLANDVSREFVIPNVATSLTGTIVDAVTKSPLPRVDVSLRFEDQEVASVRTDSDGSFTVAGISPGNYSLVVRALNSWQPFQLPWDGVAEPILELDFRVPTSAANSLTLAPEVLQGSAEGEVTGNDVSELIESLRKVAENYRAGYEESIRVQLLTKVEIPRVRAIRDRLSALKDLEQELGPLSDMVTIASDFPLPPTPTIFPEATYPKIPNDYADLKRRYDKQVVERFQTLQRDFDQYKTDLTELLKINNRATQTAQTWIVELGALDILSTINSFYVHVNAAIETLESIKQITSDLPIPPGALPEYEKVKRFTLAAEKLIQEGLKEVGRAESKQLPEVRRFVKEMNRQLTSVEQGNERVRDGLGKLSREIEGAYQPLLDQYEKDLRAAEQNAVKSRSESISTDVDVFVGLNVTTNEFAYQDLPVFDITRKNVSVRWFTVPSGATTFANGDVIYRAETDKDAYFFYQIVVTKGGRSVVSPLAFLEIIVGERDEEKKDGDEKKKEDGDDGRNYTSHTPEDKYGPGGYDAPATPGSELSRYLAPAGAFDYRIEFWNKTDAEVPTQDAVIEDTLDLTVFDLNTLELTRVGFLQWDIVIPGGQFIDTRIDLRPEMNLAVDVTASVDYGTGKIRWWFHAVDPLTGEYPENPFSGFLPPYNPATGFEIGWVEFRVGIHNDLPSGTQIVNQAFVEFDFAGDILDHPAPKEGPWINTIDISSPSSTVSPISQSIGSETFTVSWTGSDNPGGSGIASFDIYVSEHDGPFMPWLIGTTDVAAMYEGVDGSHYAFYSVARDNVGNIEASPVVADTETTIHVLSWTNSVDPLDVNDDGSVSPLDVLQVVNRLNDPQFGHTGGQLPLSVSAPPFYDVNGDGFVAPIDALIIINFLNSHRIGEGEAIALPNPPLMEVNLRAVGPRRRDRNPTAEFSNRSEVSRSKALLAISHQDSTAIDSEWRSLGLHHDDFWFDLEEVFSDLAPDLVSEWLDKQ